MNILKKKKQTRDCDTISQSVIGVTESEEKTNEEKNIWRNKSWILSRFGKEHSFTDLRNSENPKQNTCKENHIHSLIKLLKTKDKNNNP